MPNTREKLIGFTNAVLRCLPWGEISSHTAEDIADHLIDNGVTIPVLCEKCTHHDTDTCPEGKVWCKVLCRYMKFDDYCSFGERSNNVN